MYLGLDFGTSGARCIAVDDNGVVVADAKTIYGDSPADAAAWSRALFGLLDSLPAGVRGRVAGVAMDGTSSTTLLIDADTGEVLAPPRMYDEPQDAEAVARAKEMAPAGHTATAPTSTLCKVLSWDGAGAWQRAAAEGRAPAFAHQADWLAALLHGQFRATDYNNALKLGYDPGDESYPDWLAQQVGLVVVG